MNAIERATIQVLGGTCVNGVPVRGSTQARLLCVLAMRADQEVPSDTLLELCWPDGSRPQKSRVVSTVISRLRDCGLSGSQLVGSVGAYRLDRRFVAVDAQDFEDLAISAERALTAQDLRAALSDADSALSVWRGEPYQPLTTFAWAAPHIVGLNNRYLDTIDLRASLLMSQRGAQLSTSDLLAAAAMDPFRESTWCLLACAHYRLGNQAAALEILQGLRERLAEDLGIDPSAQVESLQSRILARDQDLLEGYSPIAGPSAYRSPTKSHESSGLATRGRSGSLGGAAGPVLLGSVALTANGKGQSPPVLAILEHAEELRDRMTELLESSDNISDVISELEQRADEHSNVHARIPSQHLAEVVSDFEKVQRLSEYRQRTSHQIRLCTIAARLAGIIGIEWHILGENCEAANWFYTAHLAASDTDNALLMGWSLVYRSLIPYYNGNWEATINILERALHEVGASPSAMRVMALSAMARAYARAGRSDQARELLARAYDLHVSMPQSAKATNVFGFPERRLMFYAGSALAYAGSMDEALAEQDTALRCYEESDSVDRPLICFDKATALARGHDLTSACQLGVKILAASEEPAGVLTERAREFLRSLPAVQRQSEAARELKDAIFAAQRKEGS
jgi:DNA-binding SARP family transcriptional activator